MGKNKGGGKQPTNGPYSWGSGPGSGKGLPKSSGGDGCAVVVLAGIAGVAGLVWGVARGVLG